MLRLQPIEKRINEIYQDSEAVRKSSSEDKNKTLKSLSRELNQLTPLRDYLRSEPSEDFVKKEIKRISNRLALLKQQFATYCNNDEKAMGNKTVIKAYEKLNNIPKLKKELSFYKRILKAA